MLHALYMHSSIIRVRKKIPLMRYLMIIDGLRPHFMRLLIHSAADRRDEIILLGGACTYNRELQFLLWYYIDLASKRLVNGSWSAMLSPCSSAHRINYNSDDILTISAQSSTERSAYDGKVNKTTMTLRRHTIASKDLAGRSWLARLSLCRPTH